MGVAYYLQVTHDYSFASTRGTCFICVFLEISRHTIKHSLKKILSNYGLLFILIYFEILNSSLISKIF